MTSALVMSLGEALAILESTGGPHREMLGNIGESERWEKDPEHLRTIEFYSTHIERYPAARVLDVGAGSGKVTIRIAMLAGVSRVLAHDHAVAAMGPLILGVQERHGREPELSKVSFCCEGEPWAMPFDSESFDVVICRYAMHHLADQAGAVAEMRRCLCPGGLLLYSDPAMPRHSRDTTHGLYVVREETFFGYRTYHEMIDLVTERAFQVLGVRPYDYQRGTIDDYLKPADPSMRESLIRAWCGLDAATLAELKWSGRREGPFITYPIIDIAARKIDWVANSTC